MTYACSHTPYGSIVSILLYRPTQVAQRVTIDGNQWIRSWPFLLIGFSIYALQATRDPSAAIRDES